MKFIWGEDFRFLIFSILDFRFGVSFHWVGVVKLGRDFRFEFVAFGFKV